MSEIEVLACQAFYTKRWTDEVAYIVFHLLGTLNGRYSLAQRELAFAWRDQKTLEKKWNRHRLCTTWRDALRELRREALNVNFGGIFGPLPSLEWGKGEPRDWERLTVNKRTDGAPGVPGVAAGTPLGELVIDIDLDHRAYNRTGVCDCGEKRQACAACWNTFMDPAQRAMMALLEHLGVKQWFSEFSGRRGMHWYLLDPWVVQMTNSQRERWISALAEPPTPHSEWGRTLFELLRPLAEARPVIWERVRTRSTQEPGGMYAAVMHELYPQIDRAVSTDASHLHALPCTLHPETGLLRVIVARGQLFDFANDRFNMDQLTPEILRAQAMTLAHHVTGDSIPQCAKKVREAIK